MVAAYSSLIHPGPMSRIRSRLDRLGGAFSDRPRYRTVDQHVHPDGRLDPSDADVQAACDAARAEGLSPVVVRVVYTQHSIDNGWGPAAWRSA